MELEKIKRFLRIDADDDDEDIELLYDAAKEYIVDAVGACDESIARVRLLILTICSTLYENRLFNVKDADKEIQHTLQSMIFQLQLGGAEDDADESESGGIEQTDSDISRREPGGG